MPRPKTGRPSGRPKNETPNDAHAYVRMTSAHHDLISRAVQKQNDDPENMGGRYTVSSFILAAGVKAARELLGEE